MHDAATKTREETYRLPQRANDCISNAASYRPPAKLFDAFWREGELALMFGAPGTGKTTLAIQIAEALARGEPIDGFTMPEKGQKVLYVDLVHSNEQFHLRRMADDGQVYRFSDDLHRAQLPVEPKDLCKWLKHALYLRRETSCGRCRR